jgi:hypothetical protein
VDALTAALRRGTPRVRREAAHALGTIRDTRAICPLIGALRDEVEAIRQEAADALGEIGAAAVRPLIEALAEIDRHRAGAGALPLSAVLIDKGRTGLRGETEEAAIYSPAGGTPLLLMAALRAEAGPWQAEAIARALGKIAARDPVPELRAALPLLLRHPLWTPGGEALKRRWTASRRRRPQPRICPGSWNGRRRRRTICRCPPGAYRHGCAECGGRHAAAAGPTAARPGLLVAASRRKERRGVMSFRVEVRFSRTVTQAAPVRIAANGIALPPADCFLLEPAAADGAPPRFAQRDPADGSLVALLGPGEAGTTVRYAVAPAALDLPARESSGVGVTLETASEGLAIRVPEGLVGAYRFGGGAARPFLWPLLGPGQTPVTRASRWRSAKGRRAIIRTTARCGAPTATSTAWTTGARKKATGRSRTRRSSARSRGRSSAASPRAACGRRRTANPCCARSARSAPTTSAATGACSTTP